MSQKIDDFIFRGDRVALKKELMGNCQKAKSFREKWDSYSPDPHHFTEKCKAESSLKIILAATMHEELHVHIEKENTHRVDLSALCMDEGEVTLAGEGGRVVGQEEYWKRIFEILEKDKKRPLHVVSLGGGVGHDGIAIARAFKKRGFEVQSCTVVEPNLLAGWLSLGKDITSLHVSTAESFFSRNFVRNEGTGYIFHLGTLLNVVSEDTAVDILQHVAKNMTEKDVLSVVMVDEKQFTNLQKRGHITLQDKNNAAGLAKYVYAKTQTHYKTVIRDQKKFIKFCTHLGLKKIEVSEKVEESKSVIRVTFITFKGLKLRDDKLKS